MPTPTSRRTLLLTLALLGSGMATRLQAQPGSVANGKLPNGSFTNGPLVDGQHYSTLPDTALSRAQQNSTKPQVTEVFWYGCPGCNAFDPLLNQWVQQRGDTIAFARMPAVWNRPTERHARLYHAVRELGVLEQVHAAIFASIHEQGDTLLESDAQLRFLAAHGVEAAAARKALESFGVDAAVRKADALQRELHVPGIPALIVRGRQLVGINAAVPTYSAMLQVVDQLLTS